MQQLRRVKGGLRKPGNDLADLYNNAPCGYHSCDADDVVIRMNDTELGWLGCARVDIVDKVRFSALVSARLRADYQRAFAKLKATGAPIDIESRLTRKNGAALYVRVSAMAVTDAAGMFLGSRVSVVDITRLRRVERKATRYAARLQALSHRLVEVQDHDRRWLGGELHDRIGQNLAALNLNLNAIKSGLPPQSGESVSARMEDCMRLVKKTVETASDLTAELRPAVLDDYGLVVMLRWYGEQFARRTGIAVVVEGNDAASRLAQPVETMLFHIVQEACANIAKFAKARTATITVATGPQCIRVEVADDGCGFDANAIIRRGAQPAWGLLVMRERAKIAGGRLRIESAAGRGTRITVEIRR